MLGSKTLPTHAMSPQASSSSSSLIPTGIWRSLQRRRSLPLAVPVLPEDSVFGGRGARDGVEPMDEDEEEEEEEAEKKEPAGRKIEGILEQFEKIAVGDEGNYT